MVGKFVLLAVVCVAFVQGDATLENAINRGVKRSEGINKGAQRRIDAAINEVNFNKKLIEAKASEFLQNADKQQQTFEDALSKAAETVREKAKENNKPQSVFECVDRVEENAVKSVESFVKKFQDDMERLERVKLENVATYAKPMDEMQDALKVRFERAVSIIKECQNPACVNIAINSFLNWLDLLYSEINRIRTQITTAVGNFQRDANTFLNNTNRQITRVKTASVKNVGLCLMNRQIVFGEH